MRLWTFLDTRDKRIYIEIIFYGLTALYARKILGKIVVLFFSWNFSSETVVFHEISRFRMLFRV